MADYKLPVITGTSLAVGDLLRWDGSDWVNYADSAYGIPNISSQVILGADATLTDLNTWYDILSISLPSAGTYLVSADIRGKCITTNAGYVVSKFYNSTDAADVANSERLVCYSPITTVGNQDTVPCNMIITIAAAKTIKIYAARKTGATTGQILSGAAGRTTLAYIKLI